MDIGNRIREERERLGFNQTDFGEIGRVGRKSQFSYETDKSFPDAQYLADIAQAGADVQYIVTGVRSDVALAPDERELLNLYRSAPLTGKASAVGALQGALGSTTKQVVRGNVGGNVIAGGVKNSNIEGGNKKK